MVILVNISAGIREHALDGCLSCYEVELVLLCGSPGWATEAIAIIDHFRGMTMNMIQANCRVQFTAEDVEFILSVLGKKTTTADTLVKLLTDEDTRDLILDDPALFSALLERRDCLRVSTHFYFYVLIRQTFLNSDIQNRSVADYVAEVLSKFARTEQAQCVMPGQAQSLDYFFEMIAALQQADDRNRFLLQMHIGNRSLFMTGVFVDRIRRRAQQRGAPDVRYYEELGRANYRVASDHRLARQFELTSIFSTLADRFQDTRRALNDVAERLFVLGDIDYTLDSHGDVNGGTQESS